MGSNPAGCANARTIVTTRPSTPGERTKCALPWLAVAVAAIACYASTLSFGLVLDDKQIVTSPLLDRPFDVLAVWRNGFLAPGFHYLGLYRPLSQWSLLLNGRANAILLGATTSGLGFHAVNVLLHAAASLLLLAWLRALPLRRGVPFVAALLFAVHPIHVEAVANVSARSEPMALLFGLAFLLAHRRGRFLAATLFYLAAMWSKESAAAFLAVAVAADLVLAGPGTPRPVRRWALYGCTFGVWLGLRALALRGAAPEIAYLDNPAASADAFHRVLTAAAAQLDYLRLLVWPAHQSIDYAYAHRQVLASAADRRVLAFLACVVASIVAAVLARRRAPVVALAVVGYASLFAVTSNFLFPIGAIEAERLAYMPSAFFCLLVAAVLVRIGEPLPRIAGFAWLTAIVLVLGATTARQSAAWKDEGTLIRAAVVAAPDSAKAHLLMAQVLETEGDALAALGEYEASLRIYDGYAWTWFLLGNLLERMEDQGAAVHAWRASLLADPSLLDARARLASVLLELGRRAEAVAEARELFARDPLHRAWPDLTDHLAASAPRDETIAAQGKVDLAYVALAGGDVQTAIGAAQEAILSGALDRSKRASALKILAEGWRRLGRAGGAERFEEAAQRLTGPSVPADPGSR